MRNSVFETILGLVVIVAAGAFLAFAMSTTESSGQSGTYSVTARFNSVVGVDSGTDVRMAGVKVGRVTNVSIDPERAEAVLTLSVRDDVELRDDADAKVTSDGLLGGAFISIEPGGGFETIPQDGSGEIIYTRGSVDILTLFASFAGGQGSGSDSSE
ncbi:MlaD family protein [Ponticaulis profundi]|uniref:MlaD family protein n=1 Tax=Ponticaulis profundi TaxID=2665222 RepID=A0ABW1SDM7_9PROT